MQNLPGGLPAPLPTDPAAGGPELEALATAADTKTGSFDAFPALLRNPTAITSGGAMGFPFNPGVETACTFGIVEFDNAAMVGVADILLPATPQRWWWYAGTTVAMAAGAAANTLFTLRLYVEDTDPATGLLATKVLKHNAYAAANGPEELFLDWFVLSGGGHVRATVTHQHTAALDFAGTCYLWATRITPET